LTHEPISASSRRRGGFGACAQPLCALLLLYGCDVEGHVGYWIDPTPQSAAGTSAEDDAPDARTTMLAADAAPLDPVDAGRIEPDAGHIASMNGTVSNAAGSSGSVEPAPPDACALARPGAAPLEVTVVDTNAVMYNFAGGARFPAGRYRIAYVDGCRRYDNTAAWTLHASVLAAGLSAEGRGGCYIVMSNDQAVELAPGTAGVVVGEGPDPAGAFASYDECVAANLQQAPRDVTLAAGTIGVMNAGDSSPDKTPGEAIGRRSPTYRLTRLDACP
jgi:hypothetical protein